MSAPVMISLCDLSGIMAQPWARAGYECWCVDIQHSIRRERIEDGIHYVWGDVRTWRPPHGRQIAFVSAFPPCTFVAGSGARDFSIRGGQMLRDALETFEACRLAAAWSGAPYLIENPVGVLSSIPHIGKPHHYFDPCDYAGYEGGENDTYTKKTCLWVGNGFVMPPPRRLEPVDGSRMHLMPPGDDRAALRSETPRGFTRAVFEANSQLRQIAAITAQRGEEVEQ